jgi:iron(III) transport system permease protein
LISIAVCAALKYFAVGIRSFRTAFTQVDPVLEEAARLSGAGLFSLLTRIWAPLLSQTFFSVLFLVSMPVLTELTMSVLLTGPGAATLGTLLFQLQEYANPSAAQALAFLLLTLALIGSLFVGVRKNPLPEGDSR